MVRGHVASQAKALLNVPDYPGLLGQFHEPFDDFTDADIFSSDINDPDFDPYIEFSHHGVDFRVTLLWDDPDRDADLNLRGRDYTYENEDNVPPDGDDGPSISISHSYYEVGGEIPDNLDRVGYFDIARVDGEPFTFESLWVLNESSAEPTLIQAYLDGMEVGSFTVPGQGASPNYHGNTVDFDSDGLGIDRLLFTSDDFYHFTLKDFYGSTSYSQPSPSPP